MSISVTITGSITLDESANLQTGGVAAGAEDNNDSDVSLATVSSGASAFYNRLFGATELNLSTAFATANGAAHSAANYITLTGTGGTVTSLGFTSSTGAALPVLGSGTGVATNLVALDGGAISLFRDGGTLGSRVAYGVDTQGNIVFAMYLDPAAGLASASVWMVQFEAMQNADATNYDDALTLTGLGVGAGVSSEFNFAGLPSGQNLFGMVGNTTTAFVVFGKNAALNPDNTYLNPGSDTINTSQGGGTTTIGVNNQMFDPGEGAYFTYVRGANPAYLANAVNGLDQNEADDADNIQYSDNNGATNDTIEVDSAFLRVSQTQGGAAASLSIAAFNITGSPQEEALIAARGTGAVAVTRVKVYDSAGNLLDDSNNPAGTNPSIGFSVANGIYTVTGLMSGYKVEWFTSGNHDQVLISGVGGKFDIGGFGVNEPSTVFSPLSGVRFEDDGLSMSSSLTGAPSITDDESVLGTDNSANYAASFTPSFGTDGEGATPRSYVLSTPGGDSGIVDTATGLHVFLFKVGDTIVGKAGTTSGTAATGPVVFIVSVNQSGLVTLDQQRAIIHPNTSSHDESLGLSGSNLVVLTATAFDGDNDSAGASLDITGLLNFKDDGLSIEVNGTLVPSITDDESDFNTNNHANYASNFTITLGADGAGATARTYALSTAGGDSGLIDTLSGNHVFLFKVGATIVGKAGADESSAAAGNVVVFIVSVTSSGEVTLDQQRAIVHPDTGNNNESTGLVGTGLVVLTATAFDGDGDSASAPLDITDRLNFRDDGPTITAATNSAFVVHDESAGVQSDTDVAGTAFVNNVSGATIAGLFASVPSPGAAAIGYGRSSSALVTVSGGSAGADGPASQALTYGISVVDSTYSGVQTTGGTRIYMYNGPGGLVLGRVGTENGVNDVPNANGVVAFALAVNPLNGEVFQVQYLSLLHPTGGASYDESISLDAGAVQMSVTRADGDGDTATDSDNNIGLQVRFEDDGLSIVANPTGAPSISVDETALGDNNFASYAGGFTVTLGADGAGATPRSYSLSTGGGDSGLIESGTGLSVFLFKVGDDIVGKSGANAGAAETGTTVFIVSIDQSGQVTLDQQRAVVHNPNVSANDSTTMNSVGAVVVNATAYDGDGDSASAQLNIGQLLNFVDDSPTITAQILSDSVNFVDNAFVTHSLNGSVGADITNASHQSLSGLFQYQITSFSEPTSVYPNLDGVLSAGGTVLTYYTDATHTTAVYQLTLDQTANSGAGSYTFTVLEPPPITQTNFDFTDLPSGQNLFGVIAVDKADLSKGGLLVMPNDPDINAANGTMTNVSGTVNTSKGGGPVTIGNGNQAFDTLNEGAFFCYVDNPLASAVGGMGLTQVTADDADFIDFNGTNEATRASVEIVQASGGGTVKKPGPSLQIFAWDIDPGLINTDPASRAFLIDPTLNGTQSNIIGVKIINSAGAVVEYRTNDLNGANNGGTLAGGTDAPVGIQFVLDAGSDTVGDLTDDVYSVLVSNLRAGYTIEFVTEEAHDLALVENRSGSYDIGGFNIFNNTNVPAQDFDFQVQIRDYDNDVFSSALTEFSVQVDGIIF